MRVYVLGVNSSSKMTECSRAQQQWAPEQVRFPVHPICHFRGGEIVFHNGEKISTSLQGSTPEVFCRPDPFAYVPDGTKDAVLPFCRCSGRTIPSPALCLSCKALGLQASGRSSSPPAPRRLNASDGTACVHVQCLATSLASQAIETPF